MSRGQLVVFLVGLPMTIVGVGVTVGITVGLEQGFQVALTAALVYVTATYVVLTSQVLTVSKQQAEIMKEGQLNSAAPVVMLDVISSREHPIFNEVEIDVGLMNIGKGPALNFRCWIEDPEHPELRAPQKAICYTAIGVALSDIVSERTIRTRISGYKLGMGYVRAQYESIFKKTYESCLFFPTNAAPELKYGAAKDDDIVIL